MGSTASGTPPERMLVVRCADWPVVAAGVAPDQPAAVVVADRVVAASPAARAEGVGVGQRRRAAQGQCPALEVTDRDEGREARQFDLVLEAVEAFSPRLVCVRPGVVAVPTRGPSRYFGGDVSLAAGVRSAVDTVLGDRGWADHVRVGVADGLFAASAAARLAATRTDSSRVGSGRSAGSGRPLTADVSTGDGWVVVPDGGAGPFLAPLPVAALGDPSLADLLGRLGVRTLGAFAALPEADVLARFGSDGVRRWRLAAGRDPLPVHVGGPPATLWTATTLDPPAERVDVVAFAARALADDLHQRLARAGLVCTQVRITAETDHGERCDRSWRHEGSLDAAAVVDRVRWQLDGWLHRRSAERPTAGVVHLRLDPEQVGAAVGRQIDLWGAAQEVEDRLVRAVARVEGLVGVEGVSVVCALGGRGPDEGFERRPVGAVGLRADREVVTGGESGGGAPGAGGPPPPRPPPRVDPRPPAGGVARAGGGGGGRAAGAR
ncbi:MAG: DNA polymerase Y family protein, partial [Acidimicrobiia bacterium]|nr:DNA polymerase Y family protein [Acidimicrobiia bacterium]